MGAVGEAARPMQGADLAKTGREFFGVEFAQAELAHARAIYKEAVAHAVEAGGTGRLPSQAAPRHLAHGRVAAERPKDGAFPHARHTGEKRSPAVNGGSQFVDPDAGFGIADHRPVAQAAVQRPKRLDLRGAGQIRLGQEDERLEVGALGKSQQLIQRREARRGICQGRDGHEEIHVGGDRLAPPIHRLAFETEYARAHVIDDGAIVFENTHVHDVAGDRHRPRTAHAPQLGEPGRRLAVERHPCRVPAGGDDDGAPQPAHPQDCALLAPNDASIVPILTAACSAAQYERERTAVGEIVERHGGSVRWQCSRRFDRAFASVDLREESGVAALRAATGATVYDATLIALAVSPTLPEALPALEEALAGTGRPAGVVFADVRDGALCVAWDLAQTDAGVVMTAIVAEGLNAPEIAPDRVLEALIEGRYAVRD